MNAVVWPAADAGLPVTSRRRVLFVSYFFPPAGGSGVQRSSKFVRYLPEHGFLPVVVTGPGDGGGHWTPLDASVLENVPPEVEVVRVSGPVPGDGSGPLWRTSRFLRRPSPFDRWWSEGILEAAGEVAGVSAVYVSMAPYSSAAPAARLAERLEAPWVADLRDPWALDEYAVFPTALHWTLERRTMRRLLASAAAVVLPTAGTLERLVRFFPEFESRAVAIPNGFDPADFTGPAPPVLDDDRFHLVHAGYSYGDLGRRRLRRLLGGADFDVDARPRSPEFLLAALDALLAAEPSLARQVRLHLAGPLTPHDRTLLERARCRDLVEVHGFLPHAEAIALVRSADALFLPMHRLPDGVRSTIMPGKMYEYLASGRPILAAIPDGDARDVLERAPWTRLCRPDDVDGLTEALRASIAAAGERRGACADRQRLLAPYERPRLAQRLAEVLAGVTAPAGPLGASLPPEPVDAGGGRR